MAKMYLIVIVECDTATGQGIEDVLEMNPDAAGVAQYRVNASTLELALKVVNDLYPPRLKP